MTTIEQIKTALQAHIAEAEAATPGPWYAVPHPEWIGSGHRIAKSPDEPWANFGQLAYVGPENSPFIAHARTMSPAACKCLLLAIEWLEEEAKSTTLVQHGEDSDNQPYISRFPTSEASQAKRRLQSILQEWHNLTTK